MRLRRCTALIAFTLLVLCATDAFAASPVFATLGPRGAQRGTEFELIVGGDRLHDAQELVAYLPGLTASKPEVVSPQQIKFKLKLAPDAPLGQHPLRVRTASGLSDIRTFEVGTFPVVDEKEPTNDYAQPQKIDLSSAKAVTVAGVVENE